MGLITSIKARIVLRAIEKKRKAKPFNVEESELFQLPENAPENLNNSYFFGGNSGEGESLIMRLGQRREESELFILYKKGERFLVVDKQHYAPAECPIAVKCVEPGKRWHVAFSGNLQDAKSGELFPTSFDIEFNASRPIFDFMYHGDFVGMAKAFAREKWNKSFFAEAMSSDMGMSKTIEKGAEQQPPQKYEQHHYEQAGRLSGSITIGGETSVLDLPGERDHSYGKRDWNYMNDHIWLMANTADGQVLNFSIVNYPRVKRIFCGYTDIQSDKLYSLKDYKIIHYQHNNGNGPDEMVLECEYANGVRYTIKATREVNVLTTFAGGKFYFQEAIGHFDINGIPARGSIEYGFHQDSSRWDSYQD